MFCLPFLGPLHDGAGLKQDPMHFWIDKRSQSCGYNGRQRIPASLLSGRRRRLSKPMVTPVHRFQSIEGRIVPPNRRIPTSQTIRTPTQPCIAPSISYGASRTTADQLETGMYLDNGLVEHQINMPPNPRPRRLKYYVLGLLSSAIILVTCIKYFYSFQNQGVMDISIESSLSLLAAGLMVSCMLSGCRNKGPNSHFLTTNTTPQHPALGNTELEVAGPIARRDEVLLELHNPTASTSTTQVHVEPEQPPPPYHVAILLPPQDPSILEEAPPPTYDKAVIRSRQPPLQAEKATFPDYKLKRKPGTMIPRSILNYHTLGRPRPHKPILPLAQYWD